MNGKQRLDSAAQGGQYKCDQSSTPEDAATDDGHVSTSSTSEATVVGGGGRPQASGITLHIFDVDERFCAVATDAFAGTSVQVHCAPLASSECDAVIHAGNAYGLVAGGQDRAFLEHFGPAYQLELESALRTQFCGTQPADEALVIATCHPVQHCIVHVRCFPHSSDTAFVALSAALRAVAKHNAAGSRPRVQTLACSGLGTYRGCTHASEAAAQMRAAFDVCN